MGFFKRLAISRCKNKIAYHDAAHAELLRICRACGEMTLDHLDRLVMHKAKLAELKQKLTYLGDYGDYQ